MSQTYESFGKYVLLEKLATGGMAEVYLSKNTGAGGINKFVAIKRILPQFSESPEFIDMFKDEAKIAVNLSHSNIVSIYEFGVEKNQFFLVMDYVEGRNLRQILNKMKKGNLSFSIEQVLYIIKEVAAGLDHAHRCIDGTTGKPLNITHRDMSPQNIMVSFEGETKIVDFGIAKAEIQIETTRAGTLKGKFGYMSPEQAEGQIVDLRTDIFSLGIVLWELLANDRLFIANNEINTLRKIRDCQVPPLRKINPNIPAELERICNKALARDRNLRYQTAAAFHRELNRFLNRQYPDFSPHDFSVFIKTLFANEILDNRKKLIEFARIETRTPDLPAAAPVESETSDFDMTSTDTYTHTQGQEQEESASITEKSLTDHDRTQVAPKKAVPPKPKAQAETLVKTPAASRPTSEVPARPKATDSILQVDTRRSPVREGTMSNVREGSFTGSVAGYPNYRSRSGTYSNYTLKKPGPTIPWSSVLVALILIGSGGYIFTQKPELITEARQIITHVINTSRSTQAEHIPPDTPTQVGTFASINEVNISSVPSGAEIFVDGKPVGLTPTWVKVPGTGQVNLTLKKEGFHPWTRDIEAQEVGRSLSASLEVRKVGYINIQVLGVAEIYINGEKIADRGPVTGHAVTAERELIIRAQDPLSGQFEEVTVTVPDKGSRLVTLYPGRSKETPDKNRPRARR